MNNLHLSALVLTLSVCTPLRPANANEISFSSLNSIDSTFAFSDGTQVKIKASGTVDDSVGMGVLEIKEFNVLLDGHRIDEKKFNQLFGKLHGIKLGTLEVSRWGVGETPEDVRNTYAITFDCMADAYGSLEPQSWDDHRDQIRVEFDKSGIKKVWKISQVQKDMDLE